MKAKIVFCGGCQATFDRLKAYQLLLYSDVIEDTREKVIFDNLIVISGCKNACRDIENYYYYNIYYINSLSDISYVTKHSIINSK